MEVEERERERRERERECVAARISGTNAVYDNWFQNSGSDGTGAVM